MAQATVGGTLGTKGGLRVGPAAGAHFQVGLTLEGGVRQTVDLEKLKVENDGVVVVKAGASGSITLFGVELGFRIGFDSEDPNGKLFDFHSNPTEDGTVKVSGALPVLGLLGVSGTFKVNPAGVYLSSLPGMQKP